MYPCCNLLEEGFSLDVRSHSHGNIAKFLCLWPPPLKVKHTHSHTHIRLTRATVWGYFKITHNGRLNFVSIVGGLEIDVV